MSCSFPVQKKSKAALFIKVEGLLSLSLNHHHCRANTGSVIMVKFHQAMNNDTAILTGLTRAKSLFFEVTLLSLNTKKKEKKSILKNILLKMYVQWRAIQYILKFELSESTSKNDIEYFCL
jgi:hypothetical protein